MTKPESNGDPKTVQLPYVSDVDTWYMAPGSSALGEVSTSARMGLAYVLVRLLVHLTRMLPPRVSLVFARFLNIPPVKSPLP